ncbi:MAG: hypothetical protein K2Q25_15640 [Mycobacteriaceae bacterium]|nr:hypothetical protein [Mycobacteriaceae bacterium]
MTVTTYYGIAELDSARNPTKYLPFMGAKGWQPGMSYWPTADVSQAWRFPDRQYTEEIAEVINASNPTTTVHVIELDGNGPPLTLQL